MSNRDYYGSEASNYSASEANSYQGQQYQQQTANPNEANGERGVGAALLGGAGGAMAGHHFGKSSGHSGLGTVAGANMQCIRRRDTMDPRGNLGLGNMDLRGNSDLDNMDLRGSLDLNTMDLMSNMDTISIIMDTMDTTDFEIRQNYILKVDLLPRFISNPRITRTLSCPATATFATLHEALIIAFGWSNTHLYDFKVYNHSDARGREHRLAGPESLLTITDTSLNGDMMMGPTRDSSKVKLFQVLDNSTTKGKTIHYLYDLGDGWEHVVTCTGRSDATQHISCLEGEGHGCAEDVGGPLGWEELLEAYDAESPTSDQKEQIIWYETFASNGDPEGLRGELKWKWDKDGINEQLKELTQSSGTGSTAPGSLPSILLVSLSKQPFFDEMYSALLTNLRSKATVTEVTEKNTAMEKLSAAQGQYAAIIVTDSGVIKKKFNAIQKKLVEYAQAGGTVIIGLHYCSFTRPSDSNLFFQKTWGVNWKFGNYGRYDFRLNPRANSAFMARCRPGLPQQYSMKAVHMQNARPEDQIYIYLPTSTESPAIFAKYGNGFLGWIGDVNTESETTELLLRMCGV
ncbi:hypothetical protein ASPZODRAFT_14669 [Penicilliopsis zonata CBS 506.65]|uniref:Plasmid pRiA4b Orf3-like domain-containing protein n=1 Tax=Penicilliopsis zonata CBS 506.65 TaxID=1073090 RepID=A0A1L9SMW9_9EURO|nr:hypothetical protein ASPZODRAFT_14669 [Penicilliopsis zonata CBS 506.65]OJJ48538.1 hypothetical protein ASPZODRAFT_14669 [Penicilliopsis zonata CBS 506.65]